jgi:iron complex outermembrane receptor protein
MPIYDDNESNIFQVTFDGALGEHGIKAVMGYTDYEFNNSLDSDFSPLKFLNRGRNEQHEQLSAELIISSPSDDKFEYLTGAFYQSEELSNRRYTHVDLSAVAPIQGGIFGLLNAPNPNLGGASFAAAVLGGSLSPAAQSGILDATALGSFQQDADVQKRHNWLSKRLAAGQWLCRSGDRHPEDTSTRAKFSVQKCS